MTQPEQCKQNTDPLILVREGSNQQHRVSEALAPSYAPVMQHTLAHDLVFAKAYTEFLRYYDGNNQANGNWQPFFGKDVSVQLALVSVQDVAGYQQSLNEYRDFLNDRQNQADVAGLRDRLDYLFSSCTSLAMGLNSLAENLPSDIALKKSLENLIDTQLAPALKRLLAYHIGGADIADAEKPLNDANKEKTAPLPILGMAAQPFSSLAATNLSKHWTDGQKTWAVYFQELAADKSGKSGYGNLIGSNVFDRINHLATHNSFTSIFEQFVKVYARVVSDAKDALAATLNYDGHEPHYALFLAYQQLFDYIRADMNTLSQRHLDFYYRDILRLKEKPALPGHAHVVLELAKQVDSHQLKQGEFFKAGPDASGKAVVFANDRDFIANQAKVSAIKSVYRHGDEAVSANGISKDTKQAGRIYIAPVANADEALDANQSWQPFYNKTYVNGVLTSINMAKAELGFAIASHYLWMAEGTRTVKVFISTDSNVADMASQISCYFTTADGWLRKEPTRFVLNNNASNPQLEVGLTGNDPAIIPYDAKLHGPGFATRLPVMVVKINHTDDDSYGYKSFQQVKIRQIKLSVDVEGLKTLAVSNDFGPVDISKPFQPFGALPNAGSSLIIGSQELFQKRCSKVDLSIHWQVLGLGYKTTPVGVFTVLNNASWNGDPSKTTALFTSNPITLGLIDFNTSIDDKASFADNSFYATNSTHGFVKIALNGDFGLAAYQTDLVTYLIDQAKPKPSVNKPTPVPTIPIVDSLSIHYVTEQTMILDTTSTKNSTEFTGRFFHIGAFGLAEQHPLLKKKIAGFDATLDTSIYLLPQFYHEKQADDEQQAYDAEFYLGISSLKPPQNLALLFQVADGTSNPMAQKPEPHIHWSYLANNEWLSFSANAIEDQTRGLLSSGIINFAMPGYASSDNTLLPSGMYWLRAAVATSSDAVCRLLAVIAQAVAVSFVDSGNDPAFSAQALPAQSISQLNTPDAAVKKASQPYDGFGGRGAEVAADFYRRVSERLRHKDRAIALWDYEHLILEAFPQIYQVKCLNHTYYQAKDTSHDDAVYKELAPGHVTIICIANQQVHNQRDPLKPYTSLGLLLEIEAFIKKRLSCFLQTHVHNPEFESVKVECNVRFYDRFDESFSVKQLQQAITRFLSPWAYTDDVRPSFGGKIYQSVLINFIEDQPYVDYVTDFKLIHSVDGLAKTEIEASKAIAILVSAPAAEHNVNIIKSAAAVVPQEKCPCAT